MTQQARPNPVELFERATSGLNQILSGVKQDQVNAQTPCREWKVRGLLDHVIGGASHLGVSMAGGAGPASPPTPEGDLAQLAASYRSAVAQVLEKAASPAALEAQVATPAGEMSAAQFMGILALDNLVHTWDLAKATGQNTRLDPALTEICYGMFVPGLIDMARPHGAFGPPVSVPNSASTQDKLLGYTGRQP